MVLKERINWPKFCFRVIRPRIIFHHVKDHFYSNLSSLFLFIFTLTYFFGLFSFQFSSIFLIFLHFFWTFAFLVSPTSFPGLKLFAVCLLTTDAFMIFRDSQNFTFQHFPSSMEGDPWSGFRKKISRLKRGDYWIIFCISEGIIKDDYFSSQT